MSLALYWFTAATMMFLLTVILISVVRYFQADLAGRLLRPAVALSESVSIRVWTLLVVSFGVTWLVLRTLSQHTLVIFHFSQGWRRQVSNYVIRLLGALPTVLLGNATLMVMDRLGFLRIEKAVVIAFPLCMAIMALPTVLQIGIALLDDVDSKKLEPSFALGVNSRIVGMRIMIPSIQRGFGAAVTVALCRIAIEAYIVLDQTRHSMLASQGIREAGDIVEVFNAVYSSVTIQANVGLIILLFAFALIVSVWSFGINAGVARSS